MIPYDARAVPSLSRAKCSILLEPMDQLLPSHELRKIHQLLYGTAIAL